MTPVSLYCLARRKSESGDRFEIGERQSFLLPYLSQHIRSVRYHTATQVRGSTQARHKVNCPKGQEKVPWGITVPRNPFARCNARHLRIMRSIPFIFAGAVCNNALTHCAALSCRTLRRVARMCSSMASDTANMRIHGAQSASRREEKSSAVPLLGAVAGLWSAPDYLTRERQEFKEEGKPQVVLPFCPRGGRRESPPSAERNSPR